MRPSRFHTLRNLLIAAAIVSALGLTYWHLGPQDRLFAAESERQVGESATVTLELREYQVRLDAKPVPTVADNLSGLAYDRERGHLWAVVNNPEELLALGFDGELLARYPLDGFKDVEGIVSLGGGRLLLVEEQHNALVIVSVPDQPGPLFRADHGALSLPIPGGDNKGFEGAGYDSRKDRLFVVKEHSPRGLFEIRGLKASLEGALDLKFIDRSEWIPARGVAADLSAVEYDEDEGRLLLLSHESAAVMELDGDGRFLASHALSRGSAGLRETVAQAEGMALDDRGNLYLVSEPNLFYVFAPVSSSSSR